MEEVVHGLNAFGRENRRQARANAFHILHWCGGLEHLKGC